MADAESNLCIVCGEPFTSKRHFWRDERFYIKGDHSFRLPAIPADKQAILALQRVTTGAFVHDTNQLISNYKNACELGRTQLADRCKRQMYERAIAIAQGTIQY